MHRLRIAASTHHQDSNKNDSRQDHLDDQNDHAIDYRFDDFHGAQCQVHTSHQVREPDRLQLCTSRYIFQATRDIAAELYRERL